MQPKGPSIQEFSNTKDSACPHSYVTSPKCATSTAASYAYAASAVDGLSNPNLRICEPRVFFTALSASVSVYCSTKLELELYHMEIVAKIVDD
jgi:hypothetical protein